MGRQQEIFQPTGTLVKHSAAVQISNRISLVQRRIWNLLLQQAYDELPRREKHTVSLRWLMESSGTATRNYEYIKSCLDALVGTRVRWNVLGGDKERQWGTAALLAEATIADGTLTYSFGPTLRERLHNPRIFARIRLSMQKEFGHKYALPLYELLMDYMWSGGPRKNTSETPWLSIEDTREFFGVEDAYPGFYDFRRYVLDKAVREVTQKTSIECRYEASKDGGRSYSRLKFLAVQQPAIGQFKQ